jgi:hypothetical protein
METGELGGAEFGVDGDTKILEIEIGVKSESLSSGWFFPSGLQVVG